MCGTAVLDRIRRVHQRTGRVTRRGTVLIFAAAVLSGCSGSEPPAGDQAGTPAPAPLLYPEFGPRFQRMDNLHEACRAPAQRCADGIAAAGALTRDLQAAIAAHPDPGIYAEVTRLLNGIADTLRRSPGGGCALEIHPVTTQLCAAQGGVLAVELAVANDELKKAEGVPG